MQANFRGLSWGFEGVFLAVLPYNIVIITQNFENYKFFSKTIDKNIFVVVK